MSRLYRVISPSFWIGPTGKKIRALGPEAQVVAMYLITSPHANMLGLYYLPLAYVVHETGLPLGNASKAIRALVDLEFCDYGPLR